jgi:hypothetical protein
MKVPIQITIDSEEHNLVVLNSYPESEEVTQVLYKYIKNQPEEVTYHSLVNHFADYGLMLAKAKYPDEFLPLEPLYRIMRRKMHSSRINRGLVSYNTRQEAQESSDWLNRIFKNIEIYWVQRY